MLACYFCTGFWVSLLVFLYLGRGTLPHGLDMAIVYSFAGASVTYLLDVTVSFLLARASDD